MKITIFVKKKVMKKIEIYARQNGQREVGGLILGIKDDEGNITVKDAILMEQYGVDIHFEITDKSMMDFTKNASAKMLSNILGWWHSHHSFSTFWSPDDSDCFKRLCNLSNSCLGVVVAFQGKKGIASRWRLDIKDKTNNRISIDNIRPEVLTIKNFYIDINKMKEDLTNLVKFDNREWRPCPRCCGAGQVEVQAKPCTDDFPVQEGGIVKDTTGYIG